MTEAAAVDVIAWDGEGVGHPDHRYVLLGNSLGQEIRRAPGGLGTAEILQFVWDTAAAHEGALHVMFGASYDFQMWLRELDFDSAARLHRGHGLTLGDFVVRWNGTWFELWKHGRKVVVWDLWRFWGTRFDIALRECFPDFHGLTVIEGMKQRRSEFSLEMLEEMSVYNQLELEALVMMTRQLFSDLAEARIQRPSFLTGSGALAGSLLRAHDVGGHNQRIPEEGGISAAVHRAYAAGRIECLRVGNYAGSFWTYDIRSAYPRAMLDLVSMREGEWRWVEGDHVTGWEGRLSVWLIQWAWDRADVSSLPSRGRFFPFFCRNRYGGIRYPNWGRGWQWWPEVIVARELGFSFQVLGGWVWETSDSSSPFEWVEPLYYQRLRLKRAGRTGAQRELKFALNSLYGKLCQARGSTRNRPPAFHNLAWAGWITSHCRATVLEAMCQNPYEVTYAMTDSVASTAPLELNVGEELGQWEAHEYEMAQVVQAGVVTLWEDGKPTSEKYRGFDVGSLRAEAVTLQWLANAQSGVASPLAVPTRRPVSLGSALTSRDRFGLWNSWVTSERELDVYGGSGKRWRHWDVTEKEPWRHLCAISAWEPLPAEEALEIFDGVLPLSEPYEPKWSSEDSWTLPVEEGTLRAERVLQDEVEAALLRAR